MSSNFKPTFAKKGEQDLLQKKGRESLKFPIRSSYTGLLPMCMLASLFSPLDPPSRNRRNEEDERRQSGKGRGKSGFPVCFSLSRFPFSWLFGRPRRLSYRRKVVPIGARSPWFFSGVICDCCAHCTGLGR